MRKDILISSLVIGVLYGLSNVDRSPKPILLTAVQAEHPKIVDKESLKCLADNIYFEASGEPYLGKVAVATVTMNRVRNSSFPNSVCEVVYQRSSRGCQFSWVCEVARAIRSEEYLTAENVAREVFLEGLKLRNLEEALFFHADYVTPSWSQDFVHVQTIGRHLFYRTTSNRKNMEVTAGNTTISDEFIITKEFRSAAEFSQYIETQAQARREDCIDILLEYCQLKDIDPSSVAPLITPSLKDKIQVEAESLNLIKKTSNVLPL
jgi:hypothetical protein